MLTSDRLADLEDDIDSIMESIVAKNRSPQPKNKDIRKASQRNDTIVGATLRGSSSHRSRSIQTTPHSGRTTTNQSTATSRRFSNQIETGTPKTQTLNPVPKPIHNTKANPPTTHMGVSLGSSSIIDSPRINNYARQNAKNKELAQSTSKKNRPKRRAGKFLSIALILISLLAVPLICLTVLKDPIAALLKPKSPFSAEAQKNMNIPLYYPTKLPSNYKIELNSIASPQEKVLVYSMTDDAGKRINMSLQRQPSSADLSPVYSTLTDLSEIETKFGMIKYGKSEKDMTLVNIMTGQTWVIMTFPPNQISQSELKSMIESFTF